MPTLRTSLTLLHLIMFVCLTCNTLLAQGGKVGINTTSPAAMLHVKDSSVLFSGVYPLPGTFGNPPVSGPGIRMMWYPDKAAIRAGGVTDLQWQKDSIGPYSVALGYNVKAKGFGSVALGRNTTASSGESTAMGYLTKASGSYSTAIGNSTTASGNYSTSMGKETLASGNTSTAMGIETVASFIGSTAMGGYTTSSGVSSLSTGNRTNASGDNSVAMGHYTKAMSFSSVVMGQFNDTTSSLSNGWFVNDPVFIIGNGLTNTSRKNALTVLKNGRTGINTAQPLAMLHVQDSNVVFTGPLSLPGNPDNPPVSGGGTRMMWYSNKAAFRVGRVAHNIWNRDSIGVYSFACGFDSKAKGQYSVAMGAATSAIGEASMAMGFQTLASGPNSISAGYNTTASGGNAVSFGESTIAAGESSTTMGDGTHATGNASVAMGFSTSSKGNNSVATGFATLSKSFSSMAIGRYNDTTSTSASSWILSDPVFVIGNGSSNNVRSNALTVLKNGKIGIGIHNPGYLLNFAPELGDKISLHGATGSHYGFGVQNQLLQIHADIVDSDIAFGYGSSAAFTETMRIRGNGNVGINTNSADAKLHIVKGGPSGGGYNANSSVIIESDQHSFVQFSNNNNEECGFLSGTEATSIRSGIIFSADSSIQMRTGGNLTRMVIDKNGNTAIGSFSPSFQFQVGSNSAAKPTSNTWTVASDARLKKDVHEYKDGLDELLKIKPVWFTYTGEAGLPRETGVGVLAQDLREIAPYMVGTWEHKDSSGNSTPYLSVDNGAMTYMLINAVKEQQETISTQQEQIDFLLNEIAAIKEKIQSQ